MSKRLLILAIVTFMAGSGCTTPGIHRTLQQNSQAPNSWPKILAVYMPWFGDPVVLRRQIQQARHMGISAFVVDWYGDTRPFSDHNFGLMQEAADDNHFQVALLYNEAEDDDGQATDEAISALDKAYKAYIGPEARHRAAY